LRSAAVRPAGGMIHTTRRVSQILNHMGLKVVPVRQPMPFSDQPQQIWQRFDTLEDQDDVQKVHANFDIPEEIMEKVAAAG